METTKNVREQKSQLKDLEQSLDDFEKTEDKKWFNQVGVNDPELEKENWKWVKKNLKNHIRKRRLY